MQDESQHVLMDALLDTQQVEIRESMGLSLSPCFLIPHPSPDLNIITKGLVCRDYDHFWTIHHHLLEERI
jgi:hypothetical protein